MFCKYNFIWRNKFKLLLLVSFICIFNLFLRISYDSGVSLFKLPARKIILIGREAERDLRKSSTQNRTSVEVNKPFPMLTGVRSFTNMKFGPIKILGVVGGNSSSTSVWDIYKVYAQINITHFNNTIYRCCMKYKSHTLAVDDSRTNITYMYAEYKNLFGLFHFLCSNKHNELGVRPVGVAITASGGTCSEEDVVFIEPYHPLRQPGRNLVIGAKLAYANISAMSIVEWMESNKFLGVDKIVAYYLSNLNKDALKVLNYYATTGFIDLYLFQPPWADLYPRNYKHHNRLSWNDEQIVVYDTFERYSGYRYFGIIDYDEYLIPSRNRTIKQMLDSLFATKKKIAILRFKTHNYFTSWGRTGFSNDMIIGRYINHTRIRVCFDHPKNIYKPVFTKAGRYSTHNVYAVNGFKKLNVPADEGYIRHYRTCRGYVGYRGKQRFDCQDPSQRVTNSSTAGWSMNILDNVERVRKRIFNTDA